MSSVFHRPWWLEAATDGQYFTIGTDSDSGFVATLPVYRKRMLGLNLITLPPLTRTLGPIFTATKTGARLTPRIRNRLLQQLVEKLPPDPFNQLFDPGCSELLSFRVAGFQIEVEYTARLRDCTDPEATWAGLRDKIRNEIRRSRERYTIAGHLSVADFTRFYAANIARSGCSMAPDAVTVERILTAASEHRCGAALGCLTSSGELAAAIFVVWDDFYSYYLLSTRDPKLSDNGAVSLLLLHAIDQAGQRDLGFDFDGFGTSGIVNFIRQFGAELVPRWRVTRMPRFLRVLRMLQHGKDAI